MKIEWKWMAAVGALCIGAMVAPAQGPPPADHMHGGMPGGPGHGRFGPDGEMGLHGKVVKGVPYAADAVTETTQTLTDGNHITRKANSAVYRDSEGRTRREESMDAIGPWAGAGNARKTILIHDPVAGVAYHLDPQTHTAHKMVMRSDRSMAKGPRGGRGDHPALAGRERVRPDAKTESLGKQVIEGVEAEGTRSTFVIPAGAMGNEKQIESVSERWYSADLQTVVMSKRSDPRFGDTVFKLTNIRRAEPSPDLFQPSSDYAVK